MGRPLRSLIFLAIGGAAVVFFSLVAQRGILFNQSGATAVWRLVSGKWEPTPRLPGAAIQIQSSENGIIWVSTALHAGLSRWDRDHWTWFKSEDFRTQTNYISGGFSLSGDQAWGATREAVVHWDGRQWHRLPVHGEPESIVADGNEAWTITSGGTLTHYSPSGETTSDLRGSIPASWGKRLAVAPVLGRTSDGTLWLVWKRVWRQPPGREWNSVDLPADSRLVRSLGELAWFWTGKSLVALNGPGSTVRSYALNVSRVRDVAVQNDHVWIADERGLQQVAPTFSSVAPPPNALAFTQIAMSSDGVIWAVTDLGRGAVLFRSAGLAVVLLIVLGLSVWGMRIVMNPPPRAAGQPRSWKADLPALGKIFLALIGVTGGMIVLVLAIGRILRVAPGPPAGLAVIVGFTAVVLITIALRVWKGKQALRHAIPGVLAWLVFVFATQFGLDRFLSLFRSPSMAMLGIVALGFGLAIFWAFALDWPLAWIHERLKQADYAGALSRADRLLPWWPDKATLRYMRGTTLLFEGRPREAETELRASMPLTPEARKQAIARSNLAYALMDQERYVEAAELFEESNNLSAGSGTSFNGLAEVLLRQDKQPFEALRYLDRALELKRHSITADRHMHAYMWANRACALAKLGRTEEAVAAVRKADNERAASLEFVPGAAGADWRIGLALLALGQRGEARDYFRRASEADPHGNYGRRAAKSLREDRN